MFGLQNFRGSCWVSACLQGIFRIKDVQDRYSKNEADKENPVDVSLQTIWNSNGRDGLRDFFASVKNEFLPTGRNIGDSHELLVYLLDKLPWLDKLFRFKVTERVSCTSCTYSSLVESSVLEFSLYPTDKTQAVVECIADKVKEFVATDSKCEKCTTHPYKIQLLLNTFPKVLLLHVYSDPSKNTVYSSLLTINSNQYSLMSIMSFNGGHWWAYGRNNVGDSWFTLDDMNVTQHKPSEFPLSNTMRILIYYLNE
jgi:uncharacterized UBP type Zn finger protein